jgi:hypothetical protein
MKNDRSATNVIPVKDIMAKEAGDQSHERDIYNSLLEGL